MKYDKTLIMNDKLVVKITSDKPNTESEINLRNITNKDLLIVSLIEYICNIHGQPEQLFENVCEYLVQNKIITDKTVFKKHSKVKYVYSKLIKSITLHNNIPNIPNILEIAEIADTTNTTNILNTDKILTQFKEPIYESRYRTEFIEIEKIGKGGFGTVFKVHNKLDGCLYAIKKITVKQLEDEQHNYYLNEVRHLSRLSHNNIVRYYTTWIEFESVKGKISPILYIQMELCTMSLEEYIMNRNYSGEPVNKKLDKKICKQLVKGLTYIHQQDIVHGDLNPKNVFLDDSFNVKIGDFGLSKKCYQNTTVNTNSYGNQLYISPEQIEHHICSKKSDVYSLGLILLEMITPFKTAMEKIVTIDNIKNNEYDSINLDSNLTQLLKCTVNYDYNKRVDANNIHKYLNSCI